MTKCCWSSVLASRIMLPVSFRKVVSLKCVMLCVVLKMGFDALDLSV